MLKAKICNSPDKCMTGAELRRLREEAGMTQHELAEKLKQWGWYQQKIHDLEVLKEFCLVPNEMQALLNALGATSI